MPELIADGPIIPVQLMNELDNGEVVFFCGAGISAGPSSDLPNFADLVHHVYDVCRIIPDSVEKEALDCDERDLKRRRPAFDKALGLLERDNRLGAKKLRETVVERLSKKPKGDLPVHKALIDLSRNDTVIRLVTTNFDNRFVEAGLERVCVDSAPKLPVPKPHAWSSLVHLHGRIAEHENPINLVLTAADFGRAYLTERWASRFVTELFREFTVVFVGYSVNDPVMSYMVDAIAAERSKGVRFKTAYAFADVNDSVGSTMVKDRWQAKNVEPILYRQSDKKRDTHHRLSDTLIEWARIRKDPFHARSRIALNEIVKRPEGSVVERVVWALDDSLAAETLANEHLVTEEDDFRKLEQWLDAFAEHGMLFCKTTDIQWSGLDRSPAMIGLVDDVLRVQKNPDTLDTTRKNLSRWLGRHVHVPQLLSWVLRNGGFLHPHLRREVQQQLANRQAEDPEIPMELRRLWTVLLESRPADPWNRLWIPNHYEAAASELERQWIENTVMEHIKPCLVVRLDPLQRLKFREYLDPQSPPLSALERCAHLALQIGDDNGDSWHNAKKILNNPEVLGRYAETLTDHLELAILLSDDDAVDADLRRPSIADHEQNSDHDTETDWIGWVRDSYFALVDTDRRRSENLLRRWAHSRWPLLQRLALHALTDNPKSDIQLARNILLAGRAPGLWNLSLHREILRFLRKAGKRLPGNLRVAIVQAIHAGPKTKKGWGRTNDLDRLRHYQALLLYKLSVSGARLDKPSRALAAEAKSLHDVADDRDEFLSWHEAPRWLGQEEFAPRPLVHASIADLVEALKDGQVSQEQLRGLVSLNRLKIACALGRLARDGVWPAHYWQFFFEEFALSRDARKKSVRLYDYLAAILTQAPDHVFCTVSFGIADFVHRLAKKYKTGREDDFAVLWKKAWVGKKNAEPLESTLDDILTDALNHPAGKLAEAAVERLQKYKPTARMKFPEPVRFYFDSIGKDPDGQLGRVMLATQLHYLFAVDPDWTQEHLLAHLDFNRSEEAVNLWSAYGWSPRVGPDLLRAFKESFLEMLQQTDCEFPKLSNLRHLFMTICMDAPEEWSEDDIRKVMSALPEKGLKTIIRSLKSRFTRDAQEKKQVWHKKLKPWLDQYWPQEQERNTAGTSQEFLDFLIKSGAAFADVSVWLSDYLKPIEKPFLYSLQKSGHVEMYPEEVLCILDCVVDADILQVYEKGHLRTILNVLVQERPDMESDLKIRKLYNIAME